MALKLVVITMVNQNSLTKISKLSPFFLASLWSLLLLTNFIQVVPQPDVIIGYLWKIEFALAGLITATLLIALRFPRGKFAAFGEFSNREKYWVILPLALFTFWSGLSVFWAESARNAVHHTLIWACYALFYILIRQIVARPKLLDLSLKLAGVVVSILGITCLIEYLNNHQSVSSLFTFRYYKYAETAVTLLPIYLALTLQSKTRAAYFSGAVAIIAWLLILLSFSRTEFIAGFLCIGLFFALVLTFRNYKKYRLRLVFLFLALLVPAVATQTSILKSPETATVSRFTAGEGNQKNLQWRFLVWGITLESFKRSPLLGIGADNFVVDYRYAQENYAARDTQNKLLELDEQIVAERSHNEYLQILAELGVVGSLIFGWLLLGIGTFIFSRRRKKVSLLALASLAGMAAFLVSSLASSYSFRVPANGVCFFFLLAIAAHEFLKKEKSVASDEAQSGSGFMNLKPLLIGGGLLIGGAMLIFSAVRGASLMYLQAALESSEKVVAEENYRTALALDDREPLIKYYYGLHLFDDQRADEAIPQMRFAIDHGIATSINYFTLAAAQIVARQNAEAERTFAEALRNYPRSVFLRTAYASFLEENGQQSAAAIEFDEALKINQPQAQSWQIAHREGMESLTKAGMLDKNLLPAMDLQPTTAVYALIGFQMKNNPALVQRKN